MLFKHYMRYGIEENTITCHRKDLKITNGYPGVVILWVIFFIYLYFKIFQYNMINLIIYIIP